jgi:hypothetical protein
MGVLFVSLLALLAVECIIRTRLVLRAKALALIARKAIRVASSRGISDHWKEVVLLRYAKDMAMQTAGIVLALGACGAVVVLPALLADWIFQLDPPAMQSLASLAGLSGMSAAALLYAVIRSRIRSRFGAV